MKEVCQQEVLPADEPGYGLDLVEAEVTGAKVNLIWFGNPMHLPLPDYGANGEETCINNQGQGHRYPDATS